MYNACRPAGVLPAVRGRAPRADGIRVHRSRSHPELLRCRGGGGVRPGTRALGEDLRALPLRGPRERQVEAPREGQRPKG